ncbi:MAG TPA: S8 family serine peptidase [Pirellulales bacterium]
MNRTFSLLAVFAVAAVTLATICTCPPIYAADPVALAAPKAKLAIPPVETKVKSLYSANLAISKSLAAKSAEAKSSRSLSKRSIHTMSTLDVDGGSWYALKLEFENADACKKFNVEGTHLITRFDRFADIFAAADWDDKLDDFVVNPKVEKAISDAPGIVWYDIARDPFMPPLPREPVAGDATRAATEPDKIAAGGVGKYTGKGVIVAIVDSGLDFRHPDFITKDANGNDVSRLLYFWDTTSEQYKAGKIGKPSKYTYPNDKPSNRSFIGTIFSRDELTKNLHAPYPQIPEWDSDGHGTSCASVSAGNGQGGPKDGKGKPLYAGVAPEADLIAVRVGTGDDLENEYLLGAVCEWLNEVAGDRPLVVSCSFGGHDGGHDGYLVEERQLDARFPLAGKHRAICIAAGNEGKDRFHADLSIGKGDKAAAHLRWNAKHATTLKLYFQTDNLKDLVPDEEHVKGIEVDSVHATLNALTHQAILSMTALPGDGALDLSTNSDRILLADAYFSPDSEAEFSQKESDAATAGYSAQKQIGTPGTTNNAITVGSYDWNDRFDRFGKLSTLRPVNHPKPDMKIGSLSDYSNPGYLRIGNTVKPDVASPGQWFTAAAAINSPANRDSTGLYRQFNGTSAATPYTAGVVALLMQKNPEMTLGEIKTALHKAASPPTKLNDPQHATPLPNPYWGYGKLDRAAVERLLDVKN